MTPGVELDKVTTCIRGGLRAHTASVRLYYWESVHNMAYLGIIIRQAMEAYDEHHALVADIPPLLPDGCEIVLTVRRSWGEYVAHCGEEIEEGRPYGVGSSVQEAFDNLLRVNEMARDPRVPS